MGDCEKNSLCSPVPKGVRGPRGFKGDAGEKGEKGEQGLAGPQGPSGSGGDKGDKGDPGQLGPSGPPGKDGTSGPLGPSGASGVNGTDGLQGAPGLKGDQGLPGDKGKDGNYVSVVASQNIGCRGGAQIDLHNGTDNAVSQSFVIENGCNGFDGRGVAVFVSPASGFPGGGPNGEPTNVTFQNVYAAIPGFTTNFIDTTAVGGTYVANKLRAGDIWIKQ